MGRSDVVKKPVLPPPPVKVTVVRFGLRTAALATHQRPHSPLPSPQSGKKTLIK